MQRLAVVAVAFIFIVGFGYLTITTVASQGLTLASLLALFVLLLLTVGVVGSLRDPPRR